MFQVSGAEDAILRLAAIALALGVLWRMWGKPFFDALGEVKRDFSALVELMTTEFNTNGGSTLKDAVLAMATELRASRIERQQMMQWMREHERTYPNRHEGGGG